MQLLQQPTLYRFSVSQYHSLITTGVLAEGERVELLDGLLVKHRPQHPPHAFSLIRISGQLQALCPAQAHLRTQLPIELAQSVPEPDVSVVRGADVDYANAHPQASDVLLLVEVSDSSLGQDQGDKMQIYAQAAIAQYWIVNIPDRCVEVFTQPSGPAAQPGFAQIQRIGCGTGVPLILAGVNLGSIPVDVLFV
jgi:Uma2 family endonuclease